MKNSSLIGAIAVLFAAVSTYVGAAFAKQLFPVIGIFGVTALRIGIAAMLLLAFYRPWRRVVERRLLSAPILCGTILYGTALGLMNLLIYLAFARIPIGIAVAIEVTGPLAIVLLSSRKPADFLCLIAAVTGLVLLLPLRTHNTLDPLGVACAFGAAICWAFYIVAGKKVAPVLKGDAVAWGMLVAAVLIVPVGVGNAGTALLSPYILLMGLAVALMSSALPYSLEMEAMRRLPAHVFGILLSAAPAISAVVGFVILHEALSLIQWAAILLVVAGCAGAAVSTAK